MGWLWLPVVIWVIGLLVFASPFFLKRVIRMKKHELRRKSAEAKPVDQSEGMFFTMEEEILDKIYHNNMCFVASIIGIFIFTTGFIALGFIYG